MPEYSRVRFVTLGVTAVLFQQVVMASADTWSLEQGQQWKRVSAESTDRHLLALARTERLVNSGQAKALQAEWTKLKKEFPEIKDADLNTFIRAEVFFCKRQVFRAGKYYDKFLDKDYQDSGLYETALNRQFTIAKALLAGKKRRILGIFTMKAYAEGVKMMEKISERAGDRPIAVIASTTVAKHYEEKGKFGQAHLKWSEISWQWETGQIAKDALLGMARCKYAAYKGPKYNVSHLRSAKSYYEDFKSRYAEDAKRLGIDKILKQIDEQMAYKHFTIGQYYQRTGKRQPANLYYDMVIQSWPESDAAELARQMLDGSSAGKQTKR